MVIHSSLLHTTSGNHSGNLRIFASFFYTRAWLPKRESYGDAGMQRVIRAARGRGDRRVARLFEPDGELLAHRFNGNNGERTEQQRWRQWLAEERAERQRAAAVREKPANGAAVQDAASPQPQAAPPAAGADPAATTGAVAGDGTAGKTNAAPGAAPATAAGNAPAAAGPAGADAAAVPVLNARAELGEGPVWDAANGILYWVDLFAGVVHSYRPTSGITGSVEVGEIIGCVVPRQSGGLLAATVSGIYHLDPATGAKTQVSAIEADRPETHFNDGKVDPAGRFWFGSIAVDRTSDVLGDLYSLEPDLTVTHRLRGVDNTNGMDWSPDGRTMYYIDSLTRQVTAYDYDAAGAIANPRALVTLPEGTGVPDGMTVSADGSLWVAHWGGARVTRWHPDTGAPAADHRRTGQPHHLVRVRRTGDGRPVHHHRTLPGTDRRAGRPAPRRRPVPLPHRHHRPPSGSIPRLGGIPMSNASDRPISTAVVTGGHFYEVVGFHRLFRSLDGIDAYIQHMDDFLLAPREERDGYDAVLFFTMLLEGPHGERLQPLQQIAANRQGVVVLHHSILAFPFSPFWRRWTDLPNLTHSVDPPEPITTEIADPGPSDHRRPRRLADERRNLPDGRADRRQPHPAHHLPSAQHARAGVDARNRRAARRVLPGRPRSPGLDPPRVRRLSDPRPRVVRRADLSRTTTWNGV